MNIKEAKQELLQTIQVYTRKDSNGHYLLPSVPAEDVSEDS